MDTEIYKILKGSKIFYVRDVEEIRPQLYYGLQCYKKDGTYIYSKWSSTKSLEFKKHEIIETFIIIDVVDF